MTYGFRGAAFAVAASMSLLATQTASAESLSERRKGKDTQAETLVEVACGKSDKENCAIVVPEINSRSVPNRVRLQPLESKGSVESTNGLCDDDVKVAVVQADVLATRSQATDCTGKLAVLGTGLYPYFGFMVVNSQKDASSFGDLVDNLPEGKVLRIAAGGSGSGGDYTLRVILANNPAWKNRVTIESDSSDTALSKLKDGQLDAFFVMDGPHSPLLKTVREDVNAKSKEANFKFLDFRPNRETLALKYNGEQPLYSMVTIASGFFRDTKTIATPAVIGVRNDWYQDNSKVAGTIRAAAEDSLPNIAARSGARPEWRQDFAPR